MYIRNTRGAALAISAEIVLIASAAVYVWGHQSCQVELSVMRDISLLQYVKSEKYMQDAKRLARGCEATENVRGVRGPAPPRKKV